MYVFRQFESGEYFISKEFPEYDRHIVRWETVDCFHVYDMFDDSKANLKPGEIVELTFAECEGRV